MYFKANKTALQAFTLKQCVRSVIYTFYSSIARRWAHRCAPFYKSLAPMPLNVLIQHRGRVSGVKGCMGVCGGVGGVKRRLFEVFSGEEEGGGWGGLHRAQGR